MLFGIGAGDLATGIGFILIEASYLPQIGRLYRLKEAHEFHLLYPSLNLLGRILGLLGGVLMHKSSITYGFALGILVRSTLLSQVLYYRAREARARQLSLEQVTL